MFAFQLSESTLDLAQALNNGVRPELEMDGITITYFIYKGEDEVPEIITNIEFHERYGLENFKNVMLHKI